jgi:hypothetical protein
MTSEAEQIRQMLRIADAEKRKIDESTRQGSRGVVRLWKALIANPSAENIATAIASTKDVCAAFAKAQEAYALHALTVRQLNDRAAALKGQMPG